MSLFKRSRRAPRPAPPTVPPQVWEASTTRVTAQLFEGVESLEVVGEARYQDALWEVCGATRGQRVREAIVAVLVPEPDNPYDHNAIAVQIEGHVVGYLSREDAVGYGPGIRSLMARYGAVVALEGVIAGGGHRDDGPGYLGVWLDHDPRDFGLPGREEPALPGDGFKREHDRAFDRQWFNQLPDGDRPAIEALRSMLASERDPLERHFLFSELETRLYKCRDLYASALDEFDATCQEHDREMVPIREALLSQWSRIPPLATYRQMAIRQQKLKDWNTCLWWVDRGLEIYDGHAASESAVEDLQKRRNRALAKLGRSAPSSGVGPGPTDPAG